MIHPSAIVYPCAQIGEESQLKPLSIAGIEDRFHEVRPCIIGKKSFIGSRSTIYSGVITGHRFDVRDQTTIFFDNKFGNNCRVGAKAVVKNGCRLGYNVRANA